LVTELLPESDDDYDDEYMLNRPKKQVQPQLLKPGEILFNFEKLLYVLPQTDPIEFSLKSDKPEYSPGD
jgi:hypothetical protein